MNKFSYNMEPFYLQLRAFISDRADLFTGLEDMFDDPINFDHNPAEPLSLFEATQNRRDVTQEYLDKVESFQRDLTQELIYAVLSEYFYSIPQGYDNRFYLLGKQSINQCQYADEKTWFKVCRAAKRSDAHALLLDKNDNVEDSVPIGIRNEDVRRIFHELFVAFFCELRHALPDNTWATVDFKVKGTTMILTFGEDLRHVIFEREHGTDKWEGSYYLPTGEVIE